MPLRFGLAGGQRLGSGGGGWCNDMPGCRARKSRIVLQPWRLLAWPQGEDFNECRV